MASAPTLSLPNVQLSYGPMLIGVFLNMILYGVSVGQTVTYYQVYKKDPTWMRCFVGFLFVVETANTVLDMAMMYQPLIVEYGQKPVFFPSVFMTEPLCVVLVSMPIQLFLAWRIYQLTKSFWIPAIISVLAVASFTGGVWTATMVQILRRFAEKPLLHSPALPACVADVLITVSLVQTLSKKKTGFSATDSVLDKIIRTTIQTGMITWSAVQHIGRCVLYDSSGKSRSRVLLVTVLIVSRSITPSELNLRGPLARNFVWDLSLSKLYTNCLMSTLNARQRLNNTVVLRSIRIVTRHTVKNLRKFSNTSQQSSSGFQHRRGVVLSPARSGSGKQESFLDVPPNPLGSVTYDGEDRVPDVEYGIRMTKIVEPISADPSPRSSTAH
ncbi:hypothetical protein DFH08DRAFT_979062 [Mycena albidolilacea]|uniref:DUF6534 domain-containing protein n=1 Tax=Mycena albidolilacea TaxID=1033008 RepID=A0AAD7E6V5_9AGAR|nr:hypothetical protein DFH08DRAFT_979062 [Mycena albidolilacea]